MATEGHEGIRKARSYVYTSSKYNFDIHIITIDRDLSFYRKNLDMCCKGDVDVAFGWRIVAHKHKCVFQLEYEKAT